MWDTKEEIRGKFVAFNAHIKKEESSHFRKLEKMSKINESRKKEGKQLRTEVEEMKRRKTMEEKQWNKITKKKKERQLPISGMRALTDDPTSVKTNKTM